MLKNRKVVEILQGCKKLQPTNFVGYEFATLLPPAVDCFLTLLFVVLYKFALDVILVH